MEQWNYLGFFDFTETLECDEVSKALLDCDWKYFLHSEFSEEIYKNNLKVSLESNNIKFVIAYLSAFLQENFTGPNLNKIFDEFLLKNWPHQINAREKLKVDSEEINENIRFCEYLLVAKLLIEELSESNLENLIVNWWKIRLICIHQKVLDDLTETLFRNFESTVKNLEKNSQSIENEEIRALLYIEICQGYLTFQRVNKAKDFFDQASKHLNIRLCIEGLLGKRTKFQIKPLAQLNLKIESDNNKFLLPSKNTSYKVRLPELLKLDDDIRLEKIDFIDSKTIDHNNVSSIVQVLVLTKVKLLLKSQPKDRLADEEIEPYLTFLFGQNFGPLFVRISAFLLNIHQELNHKRTIERSLKQCEEVLKMIDGNSYTVPERISHVFVCDIPCRWEVKRIFADIMFSLGLIKSSLNVYLDINSWENVISCYTKLELHSKAVEIIEQELHKQKSVKLYCLLGDVTNNISCYEKAWEYSKQSSGRAQRHWGSYYFSKKEYEKAIPHFQKSLEINPLQELILLRLGYAALITENWELATQTYIRYTHLEPHGFEAWNNLAKALIKLGKKHRAQKILQEALKCNYNSWKIWENFLIVSVDTGNIEDAVNAYSRLIELKENFIDIEILEILVKTILNESNEEKLRSTKKLKSNIMTLIGRQIVNFMSEPKLYELSALLEENIFSRAQKLLKSYNVHVQKDPSWFEDDQICLKIVKLCKEFSQNSFEAVCENNEANKNLQLSQLSSVRLSLQNCIKTLTNNINQYESIKESYLEELTTLLSEVTNKLLILKS